MKANYFIGALLVGILLCIFYFETCSAVSIKKVSTSSEKSKKSGNNTESTTGTHDRRRRQACPKIESELPESRCANDCHCHLDRSCSPSGYCHDRKRNGRSWYGLWV
ncbi:hypothetical protein Ocin01_17586 [Orchesella cincta]|uniref:Uncharacterized protein n=1 Tax=Orchesella cincta TaxID=48709 RepID=A0A1D2M7Z4_ORCCI|nr:hypothetical protein Ocin01_17586 [Orchesella cincta]